ARERTTGFVSNREGVDPRLAAYTSTQAHSSLEKAIRVAGIGSDRLRTIDVDDTFAMIPEALDAAIRADLDAGLIPTFVSATVGTTSSTAIDPLRAIGEICHRHGVWLHVDAALAGTAALLPEMRWIHDGLELADSYVFNPHKWMLTNFDCTAFFVADRSVLIRTLSILPEYLRNKASESGEVFDYRDWHLPLGRRFRALKLWFVIRHYGVEGLQAIVREHLRLAQEFAGWVVDDPEFELAAPVPLNLICFRHRGGDERNEAIMNRLNASGRLFLTHTRLDGKFTLRMSIGQTHTEERHVRRAWELIRETAGLV
ncbi:MAG TPA: aspartate aminotransferase family protein, partial [Actinobacteria bacterium]|nr:aspartate aminotransferase family protein [Actinomycetota bacterium]